MIPVRCVGSYLSVVPTDEVLGPPDVAVFERTHLGTICKYVSGWYGITTRIASTSKKQYLGTTATYS